MSLNALLATASEWLGVVAVTWIVDLLKLIRPKPLLFRYPRREGIIALCLAGVCLVISLAFYQGWLSAAITLQAPAQQMLFQRLVLAILCLALAAAALILRRQPLRSVGIGRPILPALELGLALALLTVFLRNKIYILMAGIQTEQANALPLLLGICLAEEFVFRGYILPRLSAWWGERLGLLASALLFALWQLTHLSGTFETLLLYLALAFIHGVILGWLMRKSGNILAPGLYRAISEWVTVLV